MQLKEILPALPPELVEEARRFSRPQALDLLRIREDELQKHRRSEEYRKTFEGNLDIIDEVLRKTALRMKRKCLVAVPCEVYPKPMAERLKALQENLQRRGFETYFMGLTEGGVFPGIILQIRWKHYLSNE